MLRPFWVRRARLRRQLRRRQQAFTPQISCTCEMLEDRTLLAGTADADLHVHPVFAPGTPRDYVNAHIDTPSTDPDAFQLNARWTATALSGGGLLQGDPTILTWSIVPDGTPIPSAPGINEPAAPSNLISYLGGIYGVTTADDNYIDEAWFPLFQSIYDRWSELSGITFIYEPMDDGASLGGGSPGVSGTRGDMRVGGHHIDGNGGTLAYNYYPNTGDMVIDTGDNYFETTSGNSIRLRNMLAHEVGHGIGIRHLESNDAAFLMEPFINTSFDGPQFDDILSAHRWYGDHLEDTAGGNNSAATAHHLGTLTTSGSLMIGTNGDTTSVAVADTDFVSIDGIGDVDYYSFTLSGQMEIDVLLNPVGPTYNEGPQGGSQSVLDAQARNDLILEIIDSDGTSVLATLDATGVGGSEVIGFLNLPGGTYYARVTGDLDDVQMYRLEVRDATGVDDHGNDAGTSTLISVPSVTPGHLETEGDVDYFAFNALSGGEYTFETSLLTLQDSTLTLYDTDGVTQLAFDDDGGAGLASLINWTAPAIGTYYLKVQGFSSTNTGTYSLQAGVTGLPIGLVGVDFGGASAPLNWAHVTGTITDFTLMDLTDENGVATTFDVFIDFASNNLYDNFAPTADQLPIHDQSLAGLDGNIYGTSTPIVITLQDLTPGQTYEVYVFGGDAFTNQQQVTIEGATTTQFSYGYNTNQLYVNSLPGTNTAALETFAELMEADAAGEIQITVASDDGSGFYGLAGLAIRPVETLPSGPFIVNTTADTIDVNPGDGIAEDASGNTSLRAAIMEANALAGANEIIVPAGTYTLSIAGIWESAAATGDLDILDDLIIIGDGQGLTIINGAGIDRVFDIAESVNVQFHDLTITGGQAIGDSSHVLEDRGGGIRIDFVADVLLAGVTLSGNSAPRTDGGSSFGLGGAIENVGTLTILDSRFENNMASNSGGAIYSTTTAADVSIERTTFDSNAAARGGAIFNQAVLDIDASTFSGNNGNGSGAGNGGAINNNLQGELTLTNSTLSGNISDIGGGLFNAGTATVQSSTITSNVAGSGGGIASSGSLTIENSIVAGNTATNFGPDVSGTANSLGHNLIGNTTDSTGFGATGDLLNVDPMLGSLGDHGGPTQTHVPLAGSPVINAANTATAPATDQRGIARPQGAQSDIGAVERLATPFTFIVDTLDDESDGDFSPGNFSLREAIEQSNAFETHDIIQFDSALAGGTITLSGTQIEIADGVTISGLGRDMLTINAGGLSRIFEILSGTTGIVSIDGLTLSGGLATGAFPYGGAIFQRSGDLTLTNARFIDNQADTWGGALFAFSGQMVIDNVEFAGNSTTGIGGGGAFYFQGTNAIVSNSQFSGNSSLSGGGGAIESITRLTITGSMFTGNMAHNGGVIATSNTGILTIEDSTLIGNSASWGGALRVSGNAATGSIVTILRSTIADNSANNSGGALSVVGADVVIGNTTITGNTAGTHGGGIHNAPINAQTTTIFNSTISGNSTVYHGGGIYNASTLLVRNSTITQNRADSPGTGVGKGGAIYTLSTANAPTSTTLHNTLAAGNIAGTGAGTPDDFGKVGGVSGEINIAPASSHNLVGDAATANGLIDGANGNIVGLGGTGTIPLAAILNPTLADNGGPTLTHALVGNSPALDAGDNAQATDNNGTPLTSDQRQTPFGRILDADGDATATVDIGAYEATLSSQMFLVDTLADVSDGNFGPGELSLREAIELANLSVGADTIEFAASLANGTITLGGTELLITEDVTITGLGATMLTISGDDASRIFHIDGVTTGPIDVEISGFTLTGGSATGVSPNNQGGAILNEGGNLTLLGSVVTASTAQYGGGGIASIFDGTLIVEDTTISGNTSNLIGGGIRIFGGETFLTNVLLDGNSAANAGGAIHSGGSSESPGQLTLSGVSVTGNMAEFGAGIELLQVVTATLTDSLLSGNQALSTGVGGGLIAQLGADVTIENTTITNNSAGAGGGLAIIGSDLRLENSTVSNNNITGNVGGGIAFAANPGSSTGMTIIASTISGNSTDVDGGGVFIQGGVHTLINSTISGNSAAGSGGGIEILDAATVVVRSSTITGNRSDSNGDATGVGGGISLTTGMGGTPVTTLHNTIVAGNLAGASGSDAPDDVSSSTTDTLSATSSHNLIGDAATAGGLANTVNGNIVGNAEGETIDITTILDTTLADNGGPTLTHALVVGSLAIDTGNNSAAVDHNGLALTVDQRQGTFARITDGDGNGTLTVDIGAIEAPVVVNVPNIVVTSAYLIDGNDNVITNPVLGELVRIRVDYDTINLPANASYEIHFSVDGVVLSSGVTSNGAGFATGSWFWWRSGWYAEGGTHTVTVTLDATGSVAEINEADNTASFTYTPASATDLPQKFLWPLSGTPFEDHFVTNYIDLDPRTGMIRDYTGGTATYDGHNAIDAGAVNFAGMDAVSPVFAAASGMVVEVFNGGYDRNRWTPGGIVPGGPANYVIIDHGNGWQTRYWHLREDSLQVAMGDSVTAGEVIGYEGSSGNSTGSHLHFEVRHNGQEVETFLDPTTFWLSPIDYVGDEVYLIESGVTNYDLREHLGEGPSEIAVFDQAAGIVAYAFAYFSGLQAGDILQAVWRRPNDTVYNSFTLPVLTQDLSSSSWWFSQTLPALPDVGTWTVEFVVNGLTTFAGGMFEIVPGGGEAEIRVEEATTGLVVDGRYTPIDVAEFPFAPVRVFTVFNHGYDDLEIFGLAVPEGFVIVEGLSSTIAPNSSDTFTIALDTSTAGYFAGEVSIFSSDADEAETNFAVEGQLAFGVQEQIYLGISERRLAEGDTMTANLRRSGSTASPLTVTLTSADDFELIVPTTVTIPAGQSEVLLTLVSADDGFLDGNQSVLISATAAGFTAAYQTIVVEDDETGSPTLSVSIDMASISENGGTATGTVTRNTGTTGDLQVTLMSSDTGEASVPLTISIPDGQTSATFTITGVDDAIADGTQMVTITATATGFVDGTDTIDVTDNEVATLTLTIDPASISENGGAATGTVTRNTPTGVALVVTLMSSDATEASVPVTVMIPAGQASAEFTISGVDDFIVDGTQTVTVTASASGFTGGMDSVDVTDDDSGPVTFVVDTLSDVVDGVYTTGQLSLREAVLLANESAGADTIQFHASLAGTITLGGTALDLLDDVTITGLGMSVLTVDANDLSSVFTVAMGVTAEITDLTLANGNSGNQVGGGGIRSFGDLTLRRMTIRDSRTASASNGGGGGIYVHAGSLLIEDSHIHDNESNFGGGISLGNGATAEIVRTFVEDNNATDGGGGGLRVISGAAATVSESTFSGNTSLHGGFGRGGAIHSYGLLVVSNSTFSANVGRIGGAISLGFNGISSTATITNSTFSGNQSTETGGGLHVSGGVDLQLVNSTLVGNHSDIDGGGGGGGGLRIAGGANVTMHNTIVAGNLFGTTNSANDISASSDSLDLSSSHNLIGNASTSGGLSHGVNGNIVGNAGSGTILLSSILNPVLADNGGPTLTHALVAGSLALDAGSNAAAVDHNGVPLTTDQRQGAFARILDGDGDFTPTVDIGAFEADTLPALMVTINAASISENGGMATGTVTRNTPTGSDLVVMLMSSDTGEASVPVMVTILAGQASATFDITGVDDLIADGTQTVTITASAAGFTDGTDTLDVTDNEVPTLTVSIDMASISENGGTATGTVTRNTPTDDPLEVTLMSSDTSEASVMGTVTILAGDTSADFTITGVDDAIADGTQTVTITATASGFTGGMDTIDVLDDDGGVSVVATSINGGAPNRSGIATITFTFSEAVTIAAADSFNLFNHTTGAAVNLAGAVLVNNGTTTVTLDLTGLTTSLTDGQYSLELPASEATNVSGVPLSQTYATTFHKLLGDVNGNGVVSNSDYITVQANFGNTVPAFGAGDANGNGVVSNSDYITVQANFAETLDELEFDFGDAPDSPLRPTLLANDGARHVVTGNTLWLGEGRDTEGNGQPAADASGDDINGSDDEDGIDVGNLEQGASVAVVVTANVPGTAVINGWIDFNQDGDWDDAGEQVFSDVPIVDGANNLVIHVPAGAVTGLTFARFRLTETEGYSWFGLAPNGEVEDYQLMVTAPSITAPLSDGFSTTGFKPLNRQVPVLTFQSQNWATFQWNFADDEINGLFARFGRGHHGR